METGGRPAPAARRTPTGRGELWPARGQGEENMIWVAPIILYIYIYIYIYNDVTYIHTDNNNNNNVNQR